MKLEDTNMDAALGEVDEAIARGDFTLSEFIAQFPRFGLESEQRRIDTPRAVDAVKAFENRKRPRTAKWASRHVIGGDKSKFYLVTCGRAAWHVDPKTFAVKKVH